jgi:hypothetical protein
MMFKKIIAVGVEEARRNMTTIRKKGGYPKLAPRSIVEALTDFLSVENL